MAKKDGDTPDQPELFPRALIPPEHALSPKQQLKSERVRAGVKRLASATPATVVTVEVISLAPATTAPTTAPPAPTNSPEPAEVVEVKSSTLEERSALGVTAGVALGRWHPSEGFTLLSAWLGLWIFRSRKAQFIAVAVLLGAGTAASPLGRAGWEAARNWISPAPVLALAPSQVTPPAPTSPKVTPHALTPRYQCWLFGWHPCE